MNRNFNVKGARNFTVKFKNGDRLRAVNARYRCTQDCIDFAYCEAQKENDFCFVVDAATKDFLNELERELDSLCLTPLQLKRVGQELVPLYAQRGYPSQDAALDERLDTKIAKTWAAITSGGASVELAEAKKQLKATRLQIKEQKAALLPKKEREKILKELDEDAPVPASQVPIWFWQQPFDPAFDYSYVMYVEIQAYWQTVFRQIIESAMELLYELDSKAYSYLYRKYHYTDSKGINYRLRNKLEQWAFELCRIDYIKRGRKIMQQAATYEIDEDKEVVKKGWSEII